MSGKLNFALLRKFAERDGARWRTVTRFDERHQLAIMGAAVQIGRIGAPIEFQVVQEQPEFKRLAHWTREQGWKTT